MSTAIVEMRTGDDRFIIRLSDTVSPACGLRLHAALMLVPGVSGVSVIAADSATPKRNIIVRLLLGADAAVVGQQAWEITQTVLGAIQLRRAFWNPREAVSTHPSPPHDHSTDPKDGR